MRIGAGDAPPILFVPPLFEEMNRTRALIAGVMRRLAAQGLGCWLPDLSGTGESSENLSDVHWDDWRHDVMSAAAHVERKAGRTPLIASLRGGCLIDDAAAARGWWRLAPVDGACAGARHGRARPGGRRMGRIRALGRIARPARGRHAGRSGAAADRPAGQRRRSPPTPSWTGPLCGAARNRAIRTSWPKRWPPISPPGATHAPAPDLRLRRRRARRQPRRPARARPGWCW